MLRIGCVAFPRLIVGIELAPLKSAVSPLPGTPGEVQLFATAQLASTDPFQVRVVCARKHGAIETNASAAQRANRRQQKCIKEVSWPRKERPLPSTDAKCGTRIRQRISRESRGICYAN